MSDIKLKIELNDNGVINKLNNITSALEKTKEKSSKTGKSVKNMMNEGSSSADTFVKKLDNVNKKLKNIEDSFSKVNKTLGNFKTAGLAVFGALGAGALVSGLFAAGNAVKDFVFDYIDRFNSVADYQDVFQRRFATSLNKSKENIKDLSDYAKKTPFTLERLIALQSNLNKNGFTNKEVTNVLTSYRDIFSGIGKENEVEFANILGTIKLKRKATQEELTQLERIGIPIYRKLGKTSEASFKQIDNALKNLQKRGEFFYNAFEVENNSIRTKIQNLNDSVFDSVIKVFNSDRIQNAIKSVIDKVSNFFNNIASNKNISKITSIAEGLFSRIEDFVTRIDENKVNKFFDTIFEKLDSLFGYNKFSQSNLNDLKKEKKELENFIKSQQELLKTFSPNILVSRDDRINKIKESENELSVLNKLISNQESRVNKNNLFTELDFIKNEITKREQNKFNLFDSNNTILKKIGSNLEPLDKLQSRKLQLEKLLGIESDNTFLNNNNSTALDINNKVANDAKQLRMDFDKGTAPKIIEVNILTGNGASLIKEMEIKNNMGGNSKNDLKTFTESLSEAVRKELLNILIDSSQFITK